MSRSTTDSRQIVIRRFLEQLAGRTNFEGTSDAKPANETELDNLLDSIDSENTPPLRMTASNPADLIVNVGAALIVNPENSRTRSIPTIAGSLPNSFSSGTVTFPATSGGTITVTPGNNGTLTVTSNNYIKVLVYMNSSGDLNVASGVENAVEASATVPSTPTDTLALGYVTLFNNAGTIDNVAQSKIIKFDSLSVAGASGTGADISSTFTIVNNQSSAADVTSFIVDKNNNKFFKSEYSLARRYTDTFDGTEDTAFTTAVGTGSSGQVDEFAEQSDGKIILVGIFTTFNGTSINRIIRLNSDGTEDTTFTTNVGTAANSSVKDVKVQSDGKIVLAGDFTSFNGTSITGVIRLNSDGTEDTAFTTNAGTGANAGIIETDIQSDGKIVLVGSFTSFNGTSINRIVRLNSDGTEDTAFTTNVTNIANAANATIEDVDIQSDSKIVLVGGFTSFDGTSINRIIRLNSDGTEDTTFTTNVGTGANLTVSTVHIQSDSKILLSGDFTTFNGTSINRIIRLNSDGTEDTTFTTNVGTAANSSSAAITTQSDGKIILVGFFTTFNGTSINRIIRLNSDGTEDTTFTTNVGTGANGSLNAVRYSEDNKILIGGSFTDFNGTSVNRVIRLKDKDVVENMTQGSFSGVYRPSLDIWELTNETFGGDVSGVEFSITTAGQLQYISDNLSGTELETLMKFLVYFL